MKKNIKYIILIVCIIIGIVIGVIVLNKNNAENVNSKTENTNSVLEEKIENKIDHYSTEEELRKRNYKEKHIIKDIENVVSQQSKTEQDLEENTNEKEITSTPTDKKQQAIDLVKEKWGEDDTVTFRVDSTTSKGEYVVAVISKDSVKVKNYFIVNLENMTVEVDY